MRSSKMVRAGEGGIESTRLKGPTTGLARAEEAEPARERRSSGNASISVPDEWDRSGSTWLRCANQCARLPSSMCHLSGAFLGTGQFPFQYR
jgi:hypothetical protein